MLKLLILSSAIHSVLLLLQNEANIFSSRKETYRTEILKVVWKVVVSLFSTPKEVVMSQKSATNATYKETKTLLRHFEYMGRLEQG